MGRQHGVSTAAAHRQRRSYHMAHGPFQCLCACAMLHRQVHVDFGDVDVSHDTAHRELICVGQGRGGSPSLRDRRIGQHGVILLCRLPLGGQLGIIGVLYGRGIGCLHVGVVLFTQKFSHQRVKQKPQRHNTASRRQ